MRTVVKHYHIFKNSGSSFDAILEKSFGNSFKTFEAANPGQFLLQDQVSEEIASSGSYLAYSSHTSRLPVPEIEGVEVIAVAFMRHPILRVRSIYQFFAHETLRMKFLRFIERGPNISELPLAERLAKTSDSFAAWLEGMISCDEGRSHLSNSQARFLSFGYNQRPKVISRQNGVINFDLQMAKKNLSAVHCLGRTERFEEDVSRFNGTLSEAGLPLDLSNVKPTNVKSSDFGEPLETRVTSIRRAIGEDLFNELEAITAQDMELYTWVDEKL